MFLGYEVNMSSGKKKLNRAFYRLIRIKKLDLTLKNSYNNYWIYSQPDLAAICPVLRFIN